MASKKRPASIVFPTSPSEIRHLEERCILSPNLCEQVIIEKNWRSQWPDVTEPERLPERIYAERMPAIFNHDVWFSFSDAPATSSVYYFPVERTRIWYSVYGSQWMLEQTYVSGPLCRIDLDRVNE